MLFLFLVLIGPVGVTGCTGPLGAKKASQARLIGAVTGCVYKEGFRAGCCISRGGTKCGNWASC